MSHCSSSFGFHAMPLCPGSWASRGIGSGGIPMNGIMLPGSGLALAPQRGFDSFQPGFQPGLAGSCGGLGGGNNNGMAQLMQMMMNIMMLMMRGMNGQGGLGGGGPQLNFGPPSRMYDGGGACRGGGANGLHGGHGFRAPGGGAPWNMPDVQGNGSLNGSNLPSNIKRWQPLIENAAQKYDVPPAMIAAVMQQESGGNPNAGSSAGAQGLMQFMPSTFRDVAGRNGIQGNIRDPQANVEAGAAYLHQLHNQYGSWDKALAAYNGGSRGVTNPKPETQHYVPAVLNNYRNYSAGAGTENNMGTAPMDDA